MHSNLRQVQTWRVCVCVCVCVCVYVCVCDEVAHADDLIGH